MEIFWRLILAHLLADFTFQTDHIAAWKRRSAWGTFIHSTFQLLTSVALTLTRLGETWVREPVLLGGWTCIGLV